MGKRMRIEQLRNYRSLCNEICDIKDCLRTQTKGVVVSGSSAEFPYNKISFVIEGITVSEENARVLQIVKLLEKEKEEIEDFVYSIKDTFIRQAIEYRYLLGFHQYTWEKIAQILGGGNSADGVRMMVKRYLEKNCDK